MMTVVAQIPFSSGKQNASLQDYAAQVLLQLKDGQGIRAEVTGWDFSKRVLLPVSQHYSSSLECRCDFWSFSSHTEP